MRPPSAARIARAFGLVAILSCAACASKPTMHLNHAEISGVQLATFPPTLGVLMTVVIDVHNPNSYDVAVRAVRGQVAMGSNHYLLPINYTAQGDGFWMPAGQTTPMRVPVTIPVELGVALLRDAAQSPTIPYHFTGKADVTATRTFKLEKDDYSVDEDGQVTRDQIAAIIPASIQAAMLPH